MSDRRAKPDHSIQELITSRWSPYAFSDRPVSDEDLRALFEAARWAPSSYNEQPWRYVVATKADPDEHARLLGTLVEANQSWAQAAPVLALGVVSNHFARNGKRNKAAPHDLGSASAQLCVEATARGIVVHQMIGIDPDRARDAYALPDDVEAFTGIAIGYAHEADSAPEALRERDLAARTRKPLGDFVFAGRFGDPAAWL